MTSTEEVHTWGLQRQTPWDQRVSGLQNSGDFQKDVSVGQSFNLILDLGAPKPIRVHHQERQREMTCRPSFLHPLMWKMTVISKIRWLLGGKVKTPVGGGDVAQG